MQPATSVDRLAARLLLLAPLALLSGCLIPDYEREDARRLAESQAAAGQTPAPKPVEHPATPVAGTPPAPAHAAATVAGTPPAAAPDAKQALASLLAGNQRFIHQRMERTHQDPARRVAVATGQHPLAIVVSCSDSRVPPEQVFDVGLGDIFVVRVAGNVLDAIELGSIEYAAAHLHIPLVVVMGHERCGAVKAALSGEAAPGHVSAIVKRILANLDGTTPAPGDLVDQAVRINAQASARQISESDPILKPLVAAGTLRVVSARYDLDDGVVEILP